ncbi:MAG TPA: glutathione S-transferase N-terminal domain-containing protein [Alphaproteobacteria bacterium]|jgi:GST-like protein|nr:glutathione S-transferase N-terminal domain-containing protein [Alphaproteobacteria bacterium]
MIHGYSWRTSNGRKLHIMLEETGLPYKLHPIDIRKGDQFTPEFLKISPNNKIPAIVDEEPLGGGAPLSIFESGAILLYLAEKSGKFLPTEPRARFKVLEWMFWQVGGFGPMLGQANHFNEYAKEGSDYARNRFRKEAGRLYGVLDKRLGESEYVAGREYTIADMMIFPWSQGWDKHGQNIETLPNIKRWQDTLLKRPAVQKGITLLRDLPETPMDEKARSIMFGDVQYQRH